MNPSTITSHKLQEHAYKLELNTATSKLLEYLFPDKDVSDVKPGRYRFLEKIIEKHPNFLRDLLDNRSKSIPLEWSRVLKENQSDVRFLHALAVIYREQALASNIKGKQDGHYWIISTALWSLLLSTEAFWRYFSESRFFEQNNDNRIPLKPDQQDKLMRESLSGILSLHNSLGRRDFAARHYEQSLIHLRCLDICRNGGEALLVALDDYKLPYKLNPDDDRLQQVKKMAGELLDDWGATLVREAEKNTEDAEAIKNLPEGIRKNYEGGINQLEPFVKLEIPVPRVLRASLSWYNDWCYDLYVTKNIERIKLLMQPARGVADQLAVLSIKGRGDTPENQALSQHFLLRGFTADNPEQAVKQYEEALGWNPANNNAEQLLGGAAREVFMKQIQTAIECADRKQFQEAYEILDAIERQIKEAEDKESAQMARAGVSFRHANALAMEGKFREALMRGNDALKADPDQQVIRNFVKEMEALAPEEDNLSHLNKAQKEFNKDHYNEAIKEALQVSAQSKYYANARRLQSAIYFRRGVEEAKKEQFAEAEADLEKSLNLNDDPKETKIIGTQLSHILNAHAVKLVNETQETEKQFGEALTDIITRVKRLQGG